MPSPKTVRIGIFYLRTPAKVQVTLKQNMVSLNRKWDLPYLFTKVKIYHLSLFIVLCFLLFVG